MKLHGQVCNGIIMSFSQTQHNTPSNLFCTFRQKYCCSSSKCVLEPPWRLTRCGILLKDHDMKAYKLHIIQRTESSRLSKERCCIWDPENSFGKSNMAATCGCLVRHVEQLSPSHTHEIVCFQMPKSITRRISRSAAVIKVSWSNFRRKL